MYPLAAILGMLLLGALEGERSLRGMWMRGQEHWSTWTQRLGVLGLPKPPALTTVWDVLRRVDAERVGQAWSGWTEGEAISVDGKHLRGSRRKGEAALQVLALAGQRGGEVLAQRVVEKGHGRQIGLGLSALRNGAVTLIRRSGYRYVPDAWRDFSRCPQRLPPYLVALCENVEKPCPLLRMLDFAPSVW